MTNLKKTANKNNKKIFTRILSAILCFVTILSIFTPLAMAEGTIKGNSTVELDKHNFQNRVKGEIFTVENNPGNWDVKYGIENSSGKVEYFRIPDAIKEIEKRGLKDTFVYGVTFYKISNSQIYVAFDADYINLSYDTDYYVQIINGNTTHNVLVRTTAGDIDNAFSYGSQVYMPSQLIDATAAGINYYMPYSGFKNIKNVGVSTDKISSVKISPSNNGISAIKYRDFIAETEANFGYTWDTNVRKNYHLNDDHYYLLKSNYLADGTYMLTFTMTSGPNISKNIAINGGERPYTANVSLDYSTTEIFAPTQLEGNLDIPINVSIYQGELLQPNAGYRIICSPVASGISISKNTLTITPKAIAGKYKLKVISPTSSTVYGELDFTVKRAETSYITINVADELVIPVSGSTTTILTANVHINGNYTAQESVKWSLGSFYNGVSIVDNKLMITSQAIPSKISILATLSSNPNIIGRKDITLKAADTSAKPDGIIMTGVTNNTWNMNYPYGETLDLQFYAMTGSVRNDNIEIGLMLEDNTSGIKITKGDSFNSFEIMVNGLFERKTVNLVAYSTNYPDVKTTIPLKIIPKYEGMVFTNSKFIKDGTITANGTLIVNGKDDIDAIMVLALYRGNQLIDVSMQSKLTKQNGENGSMHVFEGSIKLPKDISGVTAKIMLMRGTSLESSTEILSDPIILSQ